MNPEYYQVGPGFAAFVVTFFLALCLWLLYRSFSKKLRRQRLEQQRRTGVPGSAVASGRAGQTPAPSSGVEEDDGGRDEVANESGDR